MFHLPRSITDTLLAAPYTGGFVISMLEAMLTSRLRQLGVWGVTSVKGSEEHDHVQFNIRDSDQGITYRVTVEPIEFH